MTRCLLHRFAPGLGFAICLALSSALSAQSTYSLTEIVPPNPQFATQAFSIDSFGNVAVMTSNGGPAAGDSWIIGPSGDRYLEPLPGDFTTLPVKLSDSGRVLGGSGPDIPVFRPAIWSPQGQVRELRRNAGDSMGIPIDANGGGWVVGFTSTDYGYADMPALWLGDVLLPLGLPPGFTYGGAYGINAKNMIVGAAWDAGFIMLEGTVQYGLGAPTTIGQYPGHSLNQLIAVNSEGVSVGTSLDDAGIQYGLRRENGTLTVYPPLPGHVAEVLTSINRGGQAVGFGVDGTGFPFGVVQEGSQLFLLMNLLDPSGAGWLPLIAQEINNNGQIACTALTPGGLIGACLLTPLPDSAAAGPIGQPSDRSFAHLTPFQERMLRETLAKTMRMQGPLVARLASR